MIRLLVLLVSVGLLCPSARAQQVRVQTDVIGKSLGAFGNYGVKWETARSAWIPKAAAPPDLDGRLDDACWTDAALLTGFVRGADNAIDIYTNDVRMCYDDTWFYIGCRFAEPRPDQIKTVVKENGVQSIWTDDAVEIHFEVDIGKVYNAKMSDPCWAQFIVNSAGARFVQLRYIRDGKVHSRPQSWNDQWRSSGRVDKDAWYAEIAIPWSLLKFGPAEVESFRMNIGRNRGRDAASWNTLGYHKIERFGTVRFSRDRADGIEIGRASVQCVGEEWAASVEALAPGPRPVPVALAVTVMQGGKAVHSARSKPAPVGQKPVPLTVTLPAPARGEYSVDIHLLGADGQTLARGSASARRLPLVERMFLFRTDFAAGEKVLRGYYRLAMLPVDRKLRAEFSLMRGAEALARATLPEIKAREGQFDFDTPPLPEGASTFLCRIVDDRGREVGRLSRELRVQVYPVVQREQARFYVDEPAGVDRVQQPITVGVPFPQGILPAADVETHTRILDSNGREIPCQSRMLATWTDAGIYARWVLFDFQADLAANRGGRFSVEFGRNVRRAAMEWAPMATVDGRGRVQVDTGALAASFAADTPIFLGGLHLGGKPVTGIPEDGELYLQLADPARIQALMPREHEYRTDRSSQTFLAQRCREDFRLEVETAGPIRSVVKAAGWYADAQGERLFRYLMRMTFHRGKPWVDVSHTWIATEEEQYIYAQGLRIQGPGKPQRTVFGGDEGAPVELDWEYALKERALIQPCAEYWRVLDFGGRWPDWGLQRAVGRRARGWCDIDFGSGTNLLVAVKDFWQEFPKEIALTDDGTIEVGLVSRRGPAHLDLRSSPYTREEEAGGSSRGVAKTTRLALRFHGADADKSATAARAKDALSDIAAWVDPEWIQRADPFWQPVACCEPDSADTLKRAYANHVAMYAPRRPNMPEVVHGLELYGALNYGDRVHTLATRGWFNNEDYAIPFQEWVAYLATGNRMLLDGLLPFVRHLIDVDSLNYSPADPGPLGLQSRHRRLHWGQPGVVSHTYVDQSLLAYYLFGYERGADHAELIRQGQRASDWWPAEGWYSEATPHGAASRDYGVNLRILMNVYRHCWDPALIIRAHELWERYAASFQLDGSHPAGYFNLLRGVELYARYTADPDAIRTVLESDMECPLLRAHFGQTGPLQSWLGDAERTLSNANENAPTPWWALRYADMSPNLLVVTAIGAAEKARRQGAPLEPIRGGKLEFAGDMDIVFLEETDGEHEVQVNIWKHWQNGDATNSRAILFGTRGTRVVDLSFSTKDLPPMTHGNILRLKIPKDGQTGHYLLRLRGLDGPYMACWLAKGPAKRVFLFKPGNLSLGVFTGTRFWFHVPENCSAFRLGATALNRPSRFGFAVYDQTNRFAGGRSWYHEPYLDPKGSQWADFSVPPESRGTWWNLAYACEKGMPFTWPKELPALLADGPEAGFLPDETYLSEVAQHDD